MHTLLFVWIGVCGLLTFGWARRHAQISRAHQAASTLRSDMYDGPPSHAPKVSVIVAAKDEEPRIERCVRSLLEQDYPQFQVIVVDDRSRDRTGEILEKLRADAPDRLTVRHVTELPAGWYGKNNAVRLGVEAADGAWLLFSDGDCEQISRRSISTAVRYAQEHDIELLSAMPVVTPGCFWESLLQPVCTAILMIWHEPEKVNDPDRPQAYANGAFMLIRRDAYERVGGHQRVPGAICEDMELARIAKAEGVRLCAIQNRDLYITHMYATLAETWRGWTRIFQGSLPGVAKLGLAVVLLFAFSILPFVSVVAAAVALTASNAESDRPWFWLLVAAGLAVVTLQSVVARFYVLLRAPWWRSLLYLPAAVMCLGILVNAMVKSIGLGTTTWRGTTYQSRLPAKDSTSVT